MIMFSLFDFLIIWFFFTFSEEIGEQLEILMKEIQDHLSGSALKFYKREFDFFGQITDISWIIK